ncbi:hypothetical protein AX15_001128 [Amanita polypyramis BW_CC]|nr:hypothetical protein AX15_001128 [Amanita polypyramis BW_CC]
MASDPFTQRRVRHITSIQIRNLTPFPLRDSVASAIAKPSYTPQFTHYGQYPDDLDLIVSKKRPRKVSVNSVSTRRSSKSEGNDQAGAAEPIVGGIFDASGRKQTDLKSEFVQGSSAKRYSMSTSTLRQQRPRATSISLNELHTSANTFTSTFRDSSQDALENIISSRLVETCLVVAVRRAQPVSVATSAQPSAFLCNGKEQSGSVQSSSQKSTTLRSNRLSLPVQDKTTLRCDSTVISRVSAAKSGGIMKAVSHVKSASSPNVRRHEMFTTGASLQARPGTEDGPTVTSETYMYISSTNPPSTNPSFSFDVNLLDKNLLNSVGHKFKLEVWGRSIYNKRTTNVRGKGKDKLKEGDMHQPEWRVIDSWFIDLEKLVPLPEDTGSQVYLPPNTPLITLSPFGQVYCLPHERDAYMRPPSPLPGYSSEPEYEVTKSGGLVAGIGETYGNWRGRQRDPLDVPESGVLRATTPTYQDLSKLVSLQSQVEDALSSLLKTQVETNDELKADVLSSLRREEQELSVVINDLKNNYVAVLKMSAELRKRIEQRSNDIKERRRMLASAQEQCYVLRSRRVHCELEIATERSRLGGLRRHFIPTRTALLSTLSTIFPIELRSPPDLLYAILDVPLPIPVSANDPAPPLSTPMHKNITEETVATALGYVAQVLQLLAAYLGKVLVYPVVYIGSRSLIRDNISAMIGPRMFPLFSKGVDTYRFEYGVFLLNKNIDMLMVDRDLRALDMRHTLPNLKNLMLTLTHGEVAQLVMYSANSSTTSFFEAESSRAQSTTPRASQQVQQTTERGSPPASGATTPTALSTTTETIKSGRQFLGLGTLTDFIRLRYPSTRSINSDGTEGANAGEGNHGISSQNDNDGVRGEEQAEDKMLPSPPHTTALVSSE